MTPRKAANLVATAIEYAVKNINLAVDALNLQREEFSDSDDFFFGLNNKTSEEVDEFIVDMATSEPYITSTIRALNDLGFKIAEESDEDDECGVENLVDRLIEKVGKRDAIILVMDKITKT